MKQPFDHSDYLFELKHDGFRAVAYIEGGKCRLVSRKMKLLKFDSLAENLARLPVRDAILDGEIVCLDENGVSRFNRLLFRRGEPAFYVFDLLWLDGDDLRELPLVTRKIGLQKLVESSACSRLLYAQHIDGCGKKFFEEICKRDLEGIVAKPRLSVYKDDRDHWLKIKNRAYTQAEGRHELMTQRKAAR